VDDAAGALRAAASQASGQWQIYNAAPEVATIGELARTVQRLIQARGGWARVQGANASECGFAVSSRLMYSAHHRLATSLGAVLDYFLARR
jgi:nucleoside-diphosphate-sugar epimerase